VDFLLVIIEFFSQVLLPSLMKLGPRTPEKALSVVPNP